jgi:hypothetical protein
MQFEIPPVVIGPAVRAMAFAWVAVSLASGIFTGSAAATKSLYNMCTKRLHIDPAWIISVFDTVNPAPVKAAA